MAKNYNKKWLRRLLFLFLIVLLVGLWINYLSDPQKELWKKRIQLQIAKYHAKAVRQKKRILHSSMCKIPELNPFHTDAFNEWLYRRKVNCTRVKYGKIISKKLVVNDSRGEIRSAILDYIIRGRRRDPEGRLDPPTHNTGIIMDKKYNYFDVLNDDFHVHFSKVVKLERDPEKKIFVSDTLKHDFLRLKVEFKSGKTLTEYHAHIADENQVCRKHGKKLKKASKYGLPYNIHMVMIDAQSTGNMYRQMPHLVEMLENDEDTMLFKAHGIHGDGTTCQIMATLAGKKS